MLAQEYQQGCQAQLCGFCKFTRPEILHAPCNHIDHVRCMYPWSLHQCPECTTPVQSISIVPFTVVHQAIHNAQHMQAVQNLKMFGIFRKGRWSQEERVYADKLNKIFCEPVLPLLSDTRLPDFL